MDTIVVGLDGSKSAQSAARWAARQAQQSGARVIAVHAIPRSELWTLSAIQVDTDELRAELRRLLDGVWVAPLRRAGADFTTQLLRGDPAIEMLRIAQKVDASMLVLGTRSHSALTDLVVGGTAHKIINRSPIPVVLVPVARGAKKHAANRSRRHAQK